jgi:DNA processing protein
VTRPLGHAERRAWLRLARTQSVGSSTFAQLIARFGGAAAALDEVPRLAQRGGTVGLRNPSDDDAERELERLAKLGGRTIASCEADFPAGLAAIVPPPPLLSVIGDAGLLAREMVAVVGARNASALGRRLATTVARDLSAAGLVVASGLARGIDTAAHEGALAGGTCAVVAGGVDIVYPPENAALHERIRVEGCIVSEMPLGLAPQARHFPRRNRIISGLSRGVVVVEAAEGSGSLITARDALEQGREVFAVPGSPLDPRAKGTNRLLREGAILTECAEDVLAELRPILGRAFRETEQEDARPPTDSGCPVPSGSIRTSVEEALGPAPVEIDEIVRLCRAPAAAVVIILLEMELAGRIARHPGNRVAWA